MDVGDYWSDLLYDPVTQYGSESLEGGPPPPPSWAHRRLMEQEETDQYGWVVKNEEMEKGPTPPFSKETHTRLVRLVEVGQLD